MDDAAWSEQSFQHGFPPSDGRGSVTRTYHRGGSAEGGVRGRCSPASLRRTGSSAGGLPVEVAGASMRPTLEPGDWALAFRARRVHRGDVVVVEHPERPVSSSSSASRTCRATWPRRARAGRPGLGGGRPSRRLDRQPAFGPVPDGSRAREGLAGVVAAGPDPGAWTQVGFGCGISHLTGSICSCNDPDTLPWSRGGHDPRPMLLSRGAPRPPLGTVTEPAPRTPPAPHVRLERRSLMDVITATVDARGQSCPGRSSRCTRRWDAVRATCSSSSRPIPARGRTSRPGPSSRATSSWTRARPRASTAT